MTVSQVGDVLPEVSLCVAVFTKNVLGAAILQVATGKEWQHHHVAKLFLTSYQTLLDISTKKRSPGSGFTSGLYQVVSLPIMMHQKFLANQNFFFYELFCYKQIF